MKAIVSCGVGWQSSVIALAFTKKYHYKPITDLFPEGVIVIFANTGAEKPETLEYWYNIIEPELNQSNIENYIVMSRKGGLYDHALSNEIQPYISLRWCTIDFKITPIRRKIKKLYPILNKRGNTIKMILGITIDEIHRVKQSKVKYIENKFPLVDLGLSRSDLLKIYKQWNLDHPVKSGCYICPFQTPLNFYENIHLNHPNLSSNAIIMETLSNKQRKEKGNQRWPLLRNKFLPEHIEYFKHYLSFEQKELDDYWDQDECEGVCFT